MRLASRFVSLLVCAASLVVVGCGGGGSSGGGGGNDVDNPRRPPTIRSDLTGIVKDGIVFEGTVSVYAWNGSKGDLLTSGVLDSTGRYDITFQARSQPILIEVTNGRYTEETSTTDVRFKEGEVLLAVQNYVAGESLTTSVTYYTTLAAGLAEFLVRVGMAPSDAVVEANGRLTRVLGLDVTNVEPTDIANPGNLTTNLTSAVEYGFATAALSSLTEAISRRNNTEVHTTFTSIAFIQAAYADIRADGLLNGQGASGRVLFGATALSPTLFRRDLALELLLIAKNSTANQIGIEPRRLLAVARRLNDSLDPMFGNEPVIPFDENAPIVTNVSVQDQGILVGQPTITASVVSPLLDLASVELFVAGVSKGLAQDPQNPSFSFDTLDIEDGPAPLLIRARDVGGLVSETTINVLVANRTTVIGNVSLASGSFIRGVVNVLAEAADPAGIATLEYALTPAGGTPKVLGSSSDPKAAFVFDTTKEALGSYTFSVTATNNVGAMTTKEIPDVVIDNAVPTVGPFNFTEGAILGNPRLPTSVEVTGSDPNLESLEIRVNGRLAAANDTSIDPDSRRRSVTIGAIRELIAGELVAGTLVPVTLTGVARDRSGNEATARVNVMFDNIAPIITVSSTEVGNDNANNCVITPEITESVTLTQIVTEDPSNLVAASAKTTLPVPGVVEGIGSDGNFSFLSRTTIPVTFSPTPYVFRVLFTATDTAGNVGRRTVSVTVSPMGSTVACRGDGFGPQS